jgi:predicted DNA-binding transcriptional regulator AlpA
MPYAKAVAAAKSNLPQPKRTTETVDVARARNKIIVDVIEAAALLGLGLRTFHKLRASADFPKARVLSTRAIRWKVADLIEWADRQATDAKRPEPIELATARAARRAASASGGGLSGGIPAVATEEPRQSVASAPGSGLEPLPAPKSNPSRRRN